MGDKNFFRDQMWLIRSLLRWTILILPVAFLIGSTVALFLFLLDLATRFRFANPWLLFLLPLAGLLIHFIYSSVGKSSEKGNNLILEQIQEGGRVPWIMAPVILMTTIITHLFGGSAGREGTAIQIGGSIAANFGKWIKLSDKDQRTLLIAGMAAGFGAVFGTPLAGAVFALEVLTVGKIQYDALVPALIAALFADLTVAAWHVTHTAYHIDIFPIDAGFIPELFHLDLLLIAKVILASVLFGMASFLFARLTHDVKKICLNLIKRKWLIPVLGGLVIILMAILSGRPDYLGLGVLSEHPGSVTIPSAFHTGGSDSFSWLWKTIYTAITLGTGFKGGEVTPLFYIGATLGNTLSGLMNAPVSLFAALGFIAVFAGATNTPLACTFMGIELFGGEHALLFAIACITSYIFSGHIGIYSSQTISVSKIDLEPADRYLNLKFRKYKPDPERKQ